MPIRVSDRRGMVARTPEASEVAEQELPGLAGRPGFGGLGPWLAPRPRGGARPLLGPFQGAIARFRFRRVRIVGEPLPALDDLVDPALVHPELEGDFLLGHAR